MKPRLKVASGFAAGRLHLHSGRPCEDFALSYRSPSQDFACAVVADGAGSKRHAREGAVAACTLTAKFFKRKGKRALFNPIESGKSLLAAIQSTLRDLADGKEEVYREFGSTLLFVAVYRYKDHWHSFAGQLGDGIVILRNPAGQRLLFSQTKGEYVNETVFTTCDDPARHLRIDVRSGVGPVGFLLASDGVASNLVDGQTAATSNACNALFTWLSLHRQDVVTRAVQKNLEGIFRESSYDDVSIALIASL